MKLILYLQPKALKLGQQLRRMLGPACWCQVSWMHGRLTLTLQ